MGVVEDFALIAYQLLEAAGIGLIVMGAVTATITAAASLVRKAGGHEIFRVYRQQLGRGILLGLEMLVAADIINTVVVEPTFNSIGVLTIIVLIRTFLSFALELETTGCWPWQNGSEAKSETGFNKEPHDQHKGQNDPPGERL